MGSPRYPFTFITFILLAQEHRLGTTGQEEITKGELSVLSLALHDQEILEAVKSSWCGWKPPRRYLSIPHPKTIHQLCHRGAHVGEREQWGFLQSTQPFLCTLANSPKYQFSGFSPTSAPAEALQILFPVLGYLGPVNGLQCRVGWVIHPP